MMMRHGPRLVVYLPQIIENYQRQSGEGLSVFFVVIWLIGDLCSLSGAILAHLLPTIIILAAYVSGLVSVHTSSPTFTRVLSHITPFSIPFAIPFFYYKYTTTGGSGLRCLNKHHYWFPKRRFRISLKRPLYLARAEKVMKRRRQSPYLGNLRNMRAL